MLSIYKERQSLLLNFLPAFEGIEDHRVDLVVTFPEVKAIKFLNHFLGELIFEQVSFLLGIVKDVEGNFDSC